MNREIEFRGKSIHPFSKGRWVYGYLMEGWKQGTLCIGKWENIGGEATVKDNFGSSYEPIDPKTVGQYTGLKDKNGVKIYEGDVVKVTYYGEESLHVVKWMGEWDYPAFDLEPFLDCDSNGLSYVMCDCECETEVVDNIHNNPELLEVTGDE